MKKESPKLTKKILFFIEQQHIIVFFTIWHAGQDGSRKFHEDDPWDNAVSHAQDLVSAFFMFSTPAIEKKSFWESSVLSLKTSVRSMRKVENHI